VNDRSEWIPLGVEQKRKRKSANRRPDSYISKCTVRRDRQLANLALGRGKGGGGRKPVHGVSLPIHPTTLQTEIDSILGQLADGVVTRDRDGSVPASDLAALESWARCRVRIERLDTYIARVGLENSESVHGMLANMIRLDLDYCREFGGTPKSRVAIGLQVVQGQTAAQQLDDHLRRQYGQG